MKKALAMDALSMCFLLTCSDFLLNLNVGRQAAETPNR